MPRIGVFGPASTASACSVPWASGLPSPAWRSACSPAWSPRPTCASPARALAPGLWSLARPSCAPNREPSQALCRHTLEQARLHCAPTPASNPGVEPTRRVPERSRRQFGACGARTPPPARVPAWGLRGECSATNCTVRRHALCCVLQCRRHFPDARRLHPANGTCPCRVPLPDCPLSRHLLHNQAFRRQTLGPCRHLLAREHPLRRSTKHYLAVACCSQSIS